MGPYATEPCVQPDELELSCDEYVIEHAWTGLELFYATYSTFVHANLGRET